MRVLENHVYRTISYIIFFQMLITVYQSAFFPGLNAEFGSCHFVYKYPLEDFVAMIDRKLNISIHLKMIE